MADRHKFGDKFSRRTTRNERFQQMSSQAELIEQRKREIEAKLKAREQKSSFLDGSASSSTSSSGSVLRPVTASLPIQASSSVPLPVTVVRLPMAISTSVPVAAAAAAKAPVSFRNDGTFLDHFRKIAQPPAPEWPSSSSNYSSSSSATSGTFVTNTFIECDIPLPPTDVNPLDIPLPNTSVSPPPIPLTYCKPEVTGNQELFADQRAPSPYSPSRPCSDDEEEKECDSKSPVKTEPATMMAAATSAYYSPYEPVEPTPDEMIENVGLSVDIKKEADACNSDSNSNERARKRKSRWGPEDDKKHIPPIPLPRSVARPSSSFGPSPGLGGSVRPSTVLARSAMLSKITQSDPQILAYAVKVFGTTDLTEDQWKQCMDQIKMQYVYQEMLKKRQEREQLEELGKVKYEYDSDEDVEGGTWEHKRRLQEMEKTKVWADKLTRNASGRHHIGDFLPPEELATFAKKYQALKEGQEFCQNDYEEFKIAEDNVGYQMLKKFGWTEGQGLGVEGAGITAPVNQNNAGGEKRGLGAVRPDDLSKEDDEFEAYRKRMMLAYRFRPNPLNNPRRQYY